MEATEDPEKKPTHPTAAQILEVRRAPEAGKTWPARANARKTTTTDDPLKMARSYLSELDDTFALVLRSEMTGAQSQRQAKPPGAQRIAGLAR